MEVNGEEETMKKCSEECIPCCDYCKWCVHDWAEVDGSRVKIGVSGCDLHLAPKYQFIAIGLGYCKDFTCKYCEEV